MPRCACFEWWEPRAGEVRGFPFRVSGAVRTLAPRAKHRLPLNVLGTRDRPPGQHLTAPGTFAGLTELTDDQRTEIRAHSQAASEAT